MNIRNTATRSRTALLTLMAFLAAASSSSWAAGVKASSSSRHFAAPWAITVGTDGNLYVADSTLGSISKMTPQGRLLQRFGSKGTGPGQLLRPQAIASDAQGNIFVGDPGNRRILKFSKGRLVAGWRYRGPALAATSLALAVRGKTLFVASSHYIYKLALDGTLQGTINTGFRPYNPSNSSQQEGYSNEPQGIAFDAKGNLYDTVRQFVLCYKSCGENAYIEKRSPGGVRIKTYAFGRGFCHSPREQFCQNMYRGIALSGQTILVSDVDHFRLLAISAKGRVTGSAKQFPYGVTVGPDHLVYVAAPAKGRVVKLSPTLRVLANWS